MIELTETTIVTLMALIGGAVAGWILREFSQINRQHEILSNSVAAYIDSTKDEITNIKVDIGKIQTSVENIEEMVKK